MKFERIGKGSVINTIEGYVVITGYNGDICYMENFEVDENGEVRKAGERRLTTKELGYVAKEVDGKNHNFIFEKK